MRLSRTLDRFQDGDRLVGHAGEIDVEALGLLPVENGDGSVAGGFVVLEIIEDVHLGGGQGVFQFVHRHIDAVPDVFAVEFKGAALREITGDNNSLDVVFAFLSVLAGEKCEGKQSE